MHWACPGIEGKCSKDVLNLEHLMFDNRDNGDGPRADVTVCHLNVHSCTVR